MNKFIMWNNEQKSRNISNRPASSQSSKQDGFRDETNGQNEFGREWDTFQPQNGFSKNTLQQSIPSDIDDFPSQLIWPTLRDPLGLMQEAMWNITGRNSELSSMGRPLFHEQVGFVKGPEIPSSSLDEVPDRFQRKLKADGVVDWDNVKGKPHATAHLWSGNISDNDDPELPNDGSEKSFDSTAAPSYAGSDIATDMDLYTGKRKTAAVEAPTTNAPVAPKQRVELEKLELRKKRFGGSLDPNVPSLKSIDAVNMSLGEMISKTKGSYKMRHASFFRERSGPYQLKGNNRGSVRRAGSDYLMNGEFQEGEEITSKEKFVSTSALIDVGYGRKKRGAVVDGTSVGFGYGEGLNFDWEGIQVCVEKLVQLRCPEIIVIVPEERMEKLGMSKNEHLIDNLKKHKYLWPAWENRNSILFLLKTTKMREAVLISNDIWKSVEKVSAEFRCVKEWTFGYKFISTYIEFLNSPNGQTLEETVFNYNM